MPDTNGASKDLTVFTSGGAASSIVTVATGKWDCTKASYEREIKIPAGEVPALITRLQEAMAKLESAASNG